jgi:hypothetical protein
MLRDRPGPRHTHTVGCAGNMKSTQHEPLSEMNFVVSLALMQQVGFPCASGPAGQICGKQKVGTQMTDCLLTPPNHGHASCGPSGSICGEIHSFPGPFHMWGSGRGGDFPRDRVTHGPLVDDGIDKHWMRIVENRIHGGYTQKASDGNPGTC